MGWAYAPPLILGAAIEHRIFDLLADGAKTAAEVSRENGASLRGVRAIMNALVGFELLEKDDEGRYSLTPESAAFLVRKNPGYLGGILRHGDQLIPRWLHLSEIVKTGKPAMAVNQEGDGSAFFVDFVEDLFPVGYPSAKALAAAFPQARKVLDVAAGSGVWSIPLAQNSKEVRVTALDWPGVLPATRRVTERMGVAGQYEFLAGDLNSADLGNGYDLATLGQILHSEGETHSRALLGRVFQALAPGGTIAIAEFIANEDRTGPPLAMLFAVNMLVNTEHGDTFTVTEISQWLREAGFVDPRTMEVPAPSPLILASKPK
ncbi:MAG TPA: methyltransferase [Chthoniobacterales bacterium]|nr:methyltransferase [Chthoniobacterales bacterium]